MIQFIKHSIKNILYVLTPPVCYSCKEFIIEETILCTDCESCIMPIGPKLIQINSSYILSIHAICRYGDPLKRMICAKYYNEPIPFKAIANLLWSKTIIHNLPIDCFVPIPLHWTRKLKRGFNQATIIAQQLSKLSNIPTYELLKRTKKTDYQAQLERHVREENVKHAFALSGNIDVTGKHIMLVDDLCTTGSTAIHAAKTILKHYKPASISLVVACRAL